MRSAPTGTRLPDPGAAGQDQPIRSSSARTGRGTLSRATGAFGQSGPATRWSLLPPSLGLVEGEAGFPARTSSRSAATVEDHQGAPPQTTRWRLHPCRSCGPGVEPLENIRLAVTEAATNAVRHAYPDLTTGAFHVTATAALPGDLLDAEAVSAGPRVVETLEFSRGATCSWLGVAAFEFCVA